MKLKSLALVVIVSLFSMPLIPGAAHASDDCKKARDAVSYVEIPGARCFDLKYLTELGLSREGLSNTKKSFERAVDATIQRPDTSYTTTVGDKYSSTSRTVTYSNNPSPKQQEANEKYAALKAGEYLQATDENSKLEMSNFQKHTRVMTEISGSLATPQR